MIDGIMRKLGYINEKKLIDVAIEVYERNESGKAKTNDSFYYCIGNAYAINYIMSKFGVNFSEIIRERRKNHEKSIMDIRQRCPRRTCRILDEHRKNAGGDYRLYGSRCAECKQDI